MLLTRWAATAGVVLALVACGGADSEIRGAAAAPRAARLANAGTALPAFDGETGRLALSSVSVGGVLYGPGALQRDADGRFSIVAMPQAIGGAGVAAADYAGGKLHLASVIAGAHRYANAVLQMQADGRFELQSVRDPKPVLRTSYENKNAISFDATQVTNVRALGAPVTVAGEQDSNERSVAFGDFFQEGSYSAFVTVSRGLDAWGVPWLADSPGVAYFLARDANGQWVDRTAEVLPDPSDRTVCVWPSYSIVADFNNDGKPDVFVACTGVDYDLHITDPAQQQQVYLSEQVVFLSRADGRYERSVLPFNLYGHKASAADLDGDGNVDILVSNQALGNDGVPVVLLGDGQGGFTRSTAIFPSDLLAKTGQGRLDGLYQVELIPIAGRLDLILASTGKTVRVQGKSGGGFDTSKITTFQAATSQAYGSPYLMPLDFIFDSAASRFYFHTNAAHAAGAQWAILEYDTAGTLLGVKELWNNLGADFKSYSAQIKLAADGYFVAYTGGCAPSAMGECLMHVPR